MKIPLPPDTLCSSGVRLVPLGSEHTDLIVRWRNDPLISQWFNSTAPVTADGHRAWLARYLADPNDYTFVISTGEGEEAGMIALYNIDRARQTAEYGRLLIGESRHRGKKLALHASRLLLDIGRYLGMELIHLTVKSHNEAAIGLYERLGFGRDEEPATEPGNIRMVFRYDGSTPRATFAIARQSG